MTTTYSYQETTRPSWCIWQLPNLFRLSVTCLMMAVTSSLAEAETVLPNFHRSNSFSAPTFSGQGLASDGTKLFYLDSGGVVYTLDLEGNFLKGFASPVDTAGLALACHGTSLFVIDSSYAGTDGAVYELDASSGKVLNSFGISGAKTAATFYGGSLFVHDWWGRNLMELDPTSGAIRNIFPVGKRLNGLTTYGSSLVGSLENDDEYVELDPQSGATLSTFTLPCSLTRNQGVRGLASDGTNLYTSAVPYSGVAVIDVFTPVPEPSAVVLLLAGGCGLGIMIRRQKRRIA